MCVNHDLIKHVACDQSGLTLSIDSIIDASACGVTDGRIYVSAKGGEAPYTFQINDEALQTSAVFADRVSGIYSITVRDRNGCESSKENITLSASNFKFSTGVSSDSGCSSANGTITVTVEAGDPPFTYKIDDGIFSEVNSFTGLRAGLHTVTIADDNGCTPLLSIAVPRGNTGVSWANDVLPIMKTSCALNGCHDGKTRFNYKDYQTAKRDALSIKSRTQDKSMPFDGAPLSQSQIDLIACWVDDGARDN